MLVTVTVDKHFVITSDPEPVEVPRMDTKIVFRLDTDGGKYNPEELEFVGFISPQDLMHKEFENTKIDRDKDGLSTMTVYDRHNKDGLFRYELLFAKTDAPHDLYNYDPQIRNLPD